MTIKLHPNDSNPQFERAVVRTWTRNGDTFATAWDDKREIFIEVLVASIRFRERCLVSEDASPEVRARWETQPSSTTAIRPPGIELPLLSRYYTSRTGGVTWWREG